MPHDCKNEEMKKSSLLLERKISNTKLIAGRHGYGGDREAHDPQAEGDLGRDSGSMTKDNRLLQLQAEGDLGQDGEEHDQGL